MPSTAVPIQPTPTAEIEHTAPGNDVEATPIVQPSPIAAVDAQSSTSTDFALPRILRSIHSFLPLDIGSKELGPSQPVLPVYPVDSTINKRYIKSFQKSMVYSP